MKFSMAEEQWVRNVSNEKYRLSMEFVDDFPVVEWWYNLLSHEVLNNILRKKLFYEMRIYACCI